MSDAAIAAPTKGKRLWGATLRSAWNELNERTGGKLRSRDAALRLRVSEGELIASLVGTSATRLRTDGANIVKDIPALGPVMALTRNEHCVHEKIGPYLDVTINAMHGLVLGEQIDLRIFPSRWHHTFAVIDETDDGPRRSLQIFDADGAAVHKIYQKPATDIAAFDRLIESWRAADQSPVLEIADVPASKGDRADTEIDVERLRREWSALEDTHEFFGMLRGLEVGRLQALRLAGSSFARAVVPDALARVLEAAHDTSTPIMVFVGNPGCIQIHTGTVTNLKRMGPWFNVLDPTFNLHLREDAIASAWVVRKPTRDGDVTSLELFDKDGFCFTQLFGARKPGKPELAAWRAILSAIPVSP
ncbi:MAG: ChuX/HutX family heme-like substrate-binding protein [Rhizomicrobium sp.]